MIESISALDFIDLCANRGLNQSFQKVFGIEFSNIELLNVFKSSFVEQGREVDRYFSGDISKDWIEGKFSNLDMFAQESLIFIYDSDSISKENLSLILELSENSNHQIILFFKKDMQKKWKGRGLKVKKPAFWEGDKIFRSLARFYGVQVQRDAYPLISKHLESNCDDAFSIVETLKTFSAQEVSVEQVDSLLPKKVVNPFDFVELLNTKKLNLYYKKLASIETFDDLSQVLNFSISHLIKIGGPHGLEMSKNKYGRQIVEASSRWSEKEISSVIGRLKSISVQARLKNKKAFIETMKASITK